METKPTKKTSLDDLSPKRRKRIGDMIAYFNEIMAKKTEKGSAIHSYEYAIEKCSEKFYFTTNTAEYYIKIYG